MENDLSCKFNESVIEIERDWNGKTKSTSSLYQLKGKGKILNWQWR